MPIQGQPRSLIYQPESNILLCIRIVIDNNFGSGLAPFRRYAGLKVENREVVQFPSLI